jgi:hypothetical protein
VDREKQLLSRIFPWRVEKNVKMNERRAIIKMAIGARTMRRRTLDEAKVNRWMRLEMATSEESLVENNEVACVPGKFCFYSDLVYLADYLL